MGWTAGERLIGGGGAKFGDWTTGREEGRVWYTTGALVLEAKSIIPFTLGGTFEVFALGFEEILGEEVEGMEELDEERLEGSEEWEEESEARLPALIPSFDCALFLSKSIFFSTSIPRF